MRESIGAYLNLLQEAGINYCVLKEPFDHPEQIDLGLRMILLPKEEARYEAVVQRMRRMKNHMNTE